MKETIVSLITEPWRAFFAIMAVWIVLHLLLQRVFKPNKTQWAKLEYAWVFAGLLGLLSLVGENNKILTQNELEVSEIRLDRHFRSLSSQLNGGRHCTQWHDRGLFGEEEAKRRQLRSDTICNWANSLKEIFNDLNREDYETIENPPELIVSDRESIFFYEIIQDDLQRIEELLAERSKLKKRIAENHWDNTRRVGVLLLILAFGLRLALVSNKVRKEKRHNKA